MIDVPKTTGRFERYFKIQEMEALRSQKPHLKGQLTRLTNNVQAIRESSAQTARLRHYREQATTLVTKITAVYEELLTLVKTDEYDVVEQEFHGELTRLDEVIVSIDDLLTVDTNQYTRNDNQGGSSSACVRLPRIECPTFTGKLSEWLGFHDLFLATIHTNESLSPAQKLQYLKASLKGEAGALLATVPIADNNYTKAWDLLVNTIENLCIRIWSV